MAMILRSALEDFSGSPRHGCLLNHPAEGSPPRDYGRACCPLSSGDRRLEVMVKGPRRVRILRRILGRHEEPEIVIRK
jgi:hypothetical protein